MNKYIFLLVGCWFSMQLCAQDPVLLRVGNEAISRATFQRAYSEYKQLHTSRTSVDEYLHEFIDDRLKIAEAKAQGVGQTPDFQSQMQAYRRKLSLYFLVGQESADAILTSPLSAKQEVILITRIFKYIPQNSTNVEQEKIKSFMTLLHSELAANPRADFSEYVEKYSDDKRCVEIDRLQVTPEFERIAFSLQEGQFSAPFYTPSGIHIVKKLDKDAMQQKTKSYHKMNKPQMADYAPFLQRIKETYSYVPSQASINELMTNGETSGVLFTLGGKPYTGHDFALFAESAPKGIRRQFDDFVTKSLFDYANAQVGTAYPEFDLLLQAHYDELLLSEITRKTIIENIETDRAGIIAYFSVYKKNYRWERPRFKGAVLHSRDKKTLSEAKKLIKKKPETQWEALIDARFNTNVSQQVKIERGVFKEGDNPFVDAYVFKNGRPTALAAYPYSVVVGKKVKGPEHYEEVLAPLLADYKDFLEKRWLSRLRNTFKVEINEEVLKTVNNH